MLSFNLIIILVVMYVLRIFVQLVQELFDIELYIDLSLLNLQLRYFILRVEILIYRKYYYFIYEMWFCFLIFFKFLFKSFYGVC